MGTFKINKRCQFEAQVNQLVLNSNYIYTFRCSTETYYGLESWFKLDPQFLPNFIYCWSSNAYEYLFTTVDPFYSISRVASILKTDSNWNLVSIY